MPIQTRAVCLNLEFDAISINPEFSLESIGGSISMAQGCEAGLSMRLSKCRFKKYRDSSCIQGQIQCQSCAIASSA